MITSGKWNSEHRDRGENGLYFAGKKEYLIITMQEGDVRWWITNISSVPVKQTNTISGLTCKRTRKNREHACAGLGIYGAAWSWAQLPDLRPDVTELEEIQRRAVNMLRNGLRRNLMELEPSAGKRDSCKLMASLLSTLPFSVTSEIKEYLFSCTFWRVSPFDAIPNNYQTHTVLTESSVFLHLYFSEPQWMVC